jgi:hypothetical protein
MLACNHDEKNTPPKSCATLALSARKALNTRIPLPLYLDLCRLKDETGTSIQDLVTDILTQRKRAPAQRALKRSAIAS